MIDIRMRPRLTESFERVADFTPFSGSAYFFADNGEERSVHITEWAANGSSVSFQKIELQDGETFVLGGVRFSPRHSAAIGRLAESVEARLIYLDITGLSHYVWASLLSAFIAAGREVLVTYVEPASYKRSAAPVEGQIYDLSVSIRGIAPLPGFARLSPRQEADNDALFVPLLGFEGARFKYLLEQVQPSQENVVPIVGLPGFKTWYVFETYTGNANPLRESASWRNVRYVAGNCPFSCFFALEDIAEINPGKLIKIAPIGTKPHALGAIMFALSKRTSVEIVYDNPVRKLGRTDGSDRLLVYHVSALLKQVPFNAP